MESLRVREICKEKGITLKRLSELMNVSPELLSRAISDKGNPTLATLDKIAKALDVELVELFVRKSRKQVYGLLEIDGKFKIINSESDIYELYRELSKNSDLQE